MADSEEDLKKAAELYEQGIVLEQQKDLRGARRCYEQSLQLHEDEKVRSAYLSLMSAIGPK